MAKNKSINLKHYDALFELIYQCNQAAGCWSCTSKKRSLHFPSSFPRFLECGGLQRLVQEGKCISQGSKTHSLHCEQYDSTTIYIQFKSLKYNPTCMMMPPSQLIIAPALLPRSGPSGSHFLAEGKFHRNCKYLPFFLFSNFRKGRLLYICHVGRLVGWLVDVTINLFNIYRHKSPILTQYHLIPISTKLY